MRARVCAHACVCSCCLADFRHSDACPVSVWCLAHRQQEAASDSLTDDVMTMTMNTSTLFLSACFLLHILFHGFVEYATLTLGQSWHSKVCYFCVTDQT